MDTPLHTPVDLVNTFSAAEILDASQRYVEKLAKQHDLPNLEYRLGDIEEIPIDSRTVDLAIFSQALHHATDPLKALTEGHRILRKGGTLIVLDLLQHSFDKARDLYADTHLGFPEADLAAMIEEAGFKNVETAIVDREANPPHFQTLLAVAWR